MGQQVGSGLLQELGLTFLRAELFGYFGCFLAEGFLLRTNLLECCSDAGLRRPQTIPLLRYGIELRAAYSRGFFGFLKLELLLLEFRVLGLQLKAELSEPLIGLT